jgi:hypothetical protein
MKTNVQRKAPTSVEGVRVSTQMKPRKASSIHANLTRFPWDDPLLIAGICRIMELALAKVTSEDTASRAPADNELKVCD